MGFCEKEGAVVSYLSSIRCYLFVFIYYTSHQVDMIDILLRCDTTMYAFITGGIVIAVCLVPFL